MLEKLMKPLVESTVKAAATRGERTVAREAEVVVAKKAARVLGADARVVAKEVAAELPKVKLKDPVKLLADAYATIDAPRLSPDKQTVAYAVREEKWLPSWFKKLIGLPDDQAPETIKIFLAKADGTGEPKRLVGRTFKNAAQPAFSRDGASVVFVEQKHVFGSGERLQQMRLNKIDIKSGKVTTLWDGHPSLLHPQYSPNGKQIAVYSRTPGHEGLYLLDAANPKAAPVRLSTAADKHPVWSEDGKKLFFHTQKGGNVSKPGQEEAEQAFIGYLDMTNPAQPKRVLLDDLAAAGETYHKHPSPIAGTDLVSYHAKNPGSTKAHIEVLDTKTGQRAKLSLDGVSPSGVELKEFRHPAFSEDGSQLVLVGKGSKADAPADKPERWRVYMVERATAIAEAFKKAMQG